MSTTYITYRAGTVPKTSSTLVPDSWLYVENPTPEELEVLSKKHILELDLLYDALDQQEVPRIEIEDGSIYLFLRFARRMNGHVETVPALVVLQKNLVITISQYALPGLQQFLKGKFSVTTKQRQKILLRLFGYVNETYNSYLNEISRELRQLTAGIEKIKNKDIVQFVAYEDMLNDFAFSLARLNAIINVLMVGRIIKFTQLEKETLDEILQDNIQYMQFTKESLQSIVTIREAYSTIMSNQLNKTVKLFTSLTVILTIPTIIGSFYGMNVKLPLQDHPMAFLLIVLGSIVVCVVLLIVFVYNDWL